MGDVTTGVTDNTDEGSMKCERQLRIPSKVSSMLSVVVAHKQTGNTDNTDNSGNFTYVALTSIGSTGNTDNSITM